MPIWWTSGIITYKKEKLKKLLSYSKPKEKQCNYYFLYDQFYNPKKEWYYLVPIRSVPYLIGEIFYMMMESKLKLICGYYGLLIYAKFTCQICIENVTLKRRISINSFFCYYWKADMRLCRGNIWLAQITSYVW